MMTTDPSMPQIRELVSHYRTGKSDLAKDFFSPCLLYCKKYRRAAGFFSSSVLLIWMDALHRLVSDEGVNIQLLTSPNLNEEDLKALKAAIDPVHREELQQVIVDNLVRELVDSEQHDTQNMVRTRLFTWLVANGRLVLRFAFPEHLEESGIFYEKIGIFDFPWGDKIAFTGSANETLYGLRKNYESIDVYRSWVPEDTERVSIKEAQIEEAWSGDAEGLNVRSISEETLEYIRTRAPSSPPSQDSQLPKVVEKSIWRHQDEAVEEFLKVGRGILEMATGTGKTRTALKILTRLDLEGLIDGIIVTTDGIDLLDQWCAELDQWVVKGNRGYVVFRHYEGHHDLGDFSHQPQGSILIISRGQLRRLFRRLEPERRTRLAIVHDEIHGLGSPTLRQHLTGEHQHFAYRLGLSATPEREYDADGNIFIAEEIGGVVFQFGLEEAILRGILSEFDYVPLPYELTSGDRVRLQQVFAKKVARERDGNPMRDEEVWIEMSRVYKTAEMKPSVFEEYLPDHPSIVKNAIFFVETREYGAPILDILHGYTNLYRTYYAEDDRRNLVEFSRGHIDCLVTCHRISQGIDIKGLENVVLFSSARANLETIQRIGRCLRTDPQNPQKRATIIDFIRQPTDGDPIPKADQDRFEWLTELSKVRRES